VGISLFSIIAACLLLAGGTSLIIFLTKSLLSAAGISMPKLAIAQIKERRIESFLERRLADLERIRASHQFLIMPAERVCKPFDFIELQTHLDAIPLLSKVHQYYFETLSSYITGGNLHCERLGVLEALFSEKQSLLEATLETLRTERKLRSAKNRDPNNWAIKEISKQKQELQDALNHNTRELKEELILIIKQIQEETRKSLAEKAIH
jgi:hypothetical protein